MSGNTDGTLKNDRILKTFFISDCYNPRIGELISQQVTLLQKELVYLWQRQWLGFLSNAVIQTYYEHCLILTRAIFRTAG